MATTFPIYAIDSHHLSLSSHHDNHINSCGSHCTNSPAHLGYKIAKTQLELEQAFRLVHDCYVEKGYVTPNDAGLYLKPHHLQPGAAVFVGKLGDRVVATAAAFPDAALNLPVDVLFQSELDHLRNQGRRIVELGGLASNLALRDNSFDIPFHILQAIRIVYLYGRDYLQADDLIITINPKHQYFYEKALFFEPISDVRAYSAVNGAPAVALRHNLHTLPAQLAETKSTKSRLGQMRDLFFNQAIAHLDLHQSILWHPSLIEYFAHQLAAIT